MHVRGLIGALAVSGFLNIILLTTIFYWQTKERPPALYCEQRPIYKSSKQAQIAINESNSHLILQLQMLPYEQLIAKLKSHSPIENGFTERDFALACLVAIHHFDLSRALEGAGYIWQEQIIIYNHPVHGPNASIKVYSGLNNSHFASIIAFASSERWPQTAKGLFLLLQKRKNAIDSTLMDAFLLTPEFLAVFPLFKRMEPPVSKIEIVNFLLEGDWFMLTQLYEHQHLYGDLSEKRRQTVLLEYMQKGSRTAAILLMHDREKFHQPAKEIRPKETKEAIQTKETLIKTSPSSISQKIDSLYIVQEGDSLWKISKRFNIEVEDLKHYNKLSSDVLTPNSALRIPSN